MGGDASALLLPFSMVLVASTPLHPASTVKACDISGFVALNLIGPNRRRAGFNVLLEYNGDVTFAVEASGQRPDWPVFDRSDRHTPNPHVLRGNKGPHGEREWWVHGGGEEIWEWVVLGVWGRGEIAAS